MFKNTSKVVENSKSTNKIKELKERQKISNRKFSEYERTSIELS